MAIMGVSEKAILIDMDIGIMQGNKSVNSEQAV